MFRRKPSRCRGKQGVQIQETEKRTKGERSIVSLVTRKTKEEWSFRRYSRIDPGSKRGNDLSRESNGTSCKWKNQQIKESNVFYRRLLLRLTIARICLGRWKIRSFTKLNPTTTKHDDLCLLIRELRKSMINRGKRTSTFFGSNTSRGVKFKQRPRAAEFSYSSGHLRNYHETRCSSRCVLKKEREKEKKRKEKKNWFCSSSSTDCWTSTIITKVRSRCDQSCLLQRVCDRAIDSRSNLYTIVNNSVHNQNGGHPAMCMHECVCVCVCVCAKTNARI